VFLFSFLKLNIDDISCKNDTMSNWNLKKLKLLFLPFGRPNCWSSDDKTESVTSNLAAFKIMKVSEAIAAFCSSRDSNLLVLAIAFSY
jgi:hypothetical protein